MTDYWNEELECRPWHEVEQWQADRIAEALPKIRKRSRMYAALHDGAGNRAGSGKDLSSFEHLQALPLTTKDHLREAFEDRSDEEPFGANQAAPRDDIVQCISSSGTTGAPMYYPLTDNDREVFADAIANNWFTAGIRRSDIVAHLVGLPMVAGGLPYADGFRRIGATLCWLGGFPTERILNEMKRLRVSAFLSTTSFGIYLADRWAREGADSSIRKVLTGGEPGLAQPDIRARIGSGLGVSHLRETMGLGDVISGMWSECACQDGMHFNAQRHVAVELVDPETLEQIPWRDGTTGELVYTTITREAGPVVRYRSRDHVEVVATACSCGRTSPRIRCIGRTDDMLLYKGMNVFPTAIRDCILARFSAEIDPVIRVWKEFAGQVRFDDPIAVDVEAVAQGLLQDREGLARAIEKEVRDRLQVRVAVRLLAPGELDKSVYKNSILAVRPAADRKEPQS